VTSLAADTLAIGVGGNVGTEPEILERFRRARAALAELGDVRSAPLYRTAAIGPVQPAYLNSVVRVRMPDTTPGELAQTVLELERLLGRDRSREVRFGPRAIDLDVLLWGARQIRTPELEVPHPRLGERRFVIEPLVALFGDALVVPGIGHSLGELALEVASQEVELLTGVW
jgi:2-amino-4-hydroxy-6-hydroxymethyldihydropteridine diphosphokinase